MTYLFELPILFLVTLLDGFYRSFTKYHIGTIFLLTICMTLGLFKVFIINSIIMTFILIKNFTLLQNYYGLFKNSLDNFVSFNILMKDNNNVMDVAIYINYILDIIEQ